MSAPHSTVRTRITFTYSLGTLERGLVELALLYLAAQDGSGASWAYRGGVFPSYTVTTPLDRVQAAFASGWADASLDALACELRDQGRPEYAIEVTVGLYRYAALVLDPPGSQPRPPFRIETLEQS